MNNLKIKKLRMSCILSLILILNALQAETIISDIVIYGGTSAGVIAAVKSVQMGKTVALIEPRKHVGGLTSGGLGFVDVGDPKTIGGLSREYFHQIWNHYERDSAWVYEKRTELPGQHSKLSNDEKTLWLVEPSVAEKIFKEMLRDNKILIHFNESLNRTNGVKKKDGKIIAIEMKSKKRFIGKVYIDATYEGDLMAATGVEYTLGREANSLYGETLNGVRILRGKNEVKIDPFIRKGDPLSGLLPRVFPWSDPVDGSGDQGLQAYCYRMCLTDVPENRVMIEKPEGYLEQNYELLFRAIDAGIKKQFFFKLSALPNRKTDSNNHNSYVSTDYIGMNWNYPEADDETRLKIEQEHKHWQKGLVWTLQNHPRVKKEVRDYYAPWGLPKDEFVDNNHWSHQLYVREARRMISDYVVTEKTALGKEKINDSIGLGSYHMDSHCTKLMVNPEGYLTSDGGMFSSVPQPFPISYRAIVPKRNQCINLLVPVCSSASHAAYGSIRMEPVFMVLAESAAIAASLAIDKKIPLQDIPYSMLKPILVSSGQIVAPDSLKGMKNK